MFQKANTFLIAEIFVRNFFSSNSVNTFFSPLYLEKINSNTVECDNINTSQVTSDFVKNVEKLKSEDRFIIRSKNKVLRYQIIKKSSQI